MHVLATFLHIQEPEEPERSSMAKKKLGYVELEWTCPVCDTRNPGSRRVCSGCGSPQPDDVSFEAPAQSELISNQEEVERAQSAPDIHCPYCDARNPAGAQTCKQCGGELTGGDQRETGEVVGSFGPSSAAPVLCPACDTPNPAIRHDMFELWCTASEIAGQGRRKNETNVCSESIAGEKLRMP